MNRRTVQLGFALFSLAWVSRRYVFLTKSRVAVRQQSRPNNGNCSMSCAKALGDVPTMSGS